MGYMLAFGPCISCNAIFAFNPERVPSSSAVTGQREPICKDCLWKINEKRRELGLDQIVPLPGAYDAEECD